MGIFVDGYIDWKDKQRDEASWNLNEVQLVYSCEQGSFLTRKEFRKHSLAPRHVHRDGRQRVPSPDHPVWKQLDELCRETLPGQTNWLRLRRWGRSKTHEYRFLTKEDALLIKLVFQ